MDSIDQIRQLTLRLKEYLVSLSVDSRIGAFRCKC